MKESDTWWLTKNVSRQWDWWDTIEKDCEIRFPEFSDTLILNKNIIYQETPDFKDYIGKSVLIIGGGDSINDMNWETLNGYDYVWSVNHFFLHPILKDIKMDLVMMMAEPDLNHPEWIKYRDKHKPYVGFEVSTKWTRYDFDDYDKYFCMHTHYYSLLGACTRMIIFACELGASVVDFVGMDGYKSIKEGKHGFQPGKTNLPGSLHKFGGMNPNQVFRCEYQLFWEMIIENYPSTEINNLGGGEEYHKGLMYRNTV